MPGQFSIHANGIVLVGSNYNGEVLHIRKFEIEDLRLEDLRLEDLKFEDLKFEDLKLEDLRFPAPILYSLLIFILNSYS